MEDVALAWWHRPPVTNTTSQGSGGLPACPGLSLGTGMHVSDERWVPGPPKHSLLQSRKRDGLGLLGCTLVSWREEVCWN